MVTTECKPTCGLVGPSFSSLVIVALGMTLKVSTLSETFELFPLEFQKIRGPEWKNGFV